jgi:type I restriction enzyme S subunit
MARPSELFAATLPTAELDRTYVFIRDDEFDGSHRRYLEDLWAEFEPHADRNFLIEFPRRGQFHARVWEMRLTVVLKRFGLPVCARRVGGGPDIRIDTNPVVWIEAVAPLGTVEQWALHELAMRRPVPVLEPEILLRYTQAIREKWNKYNGYLNRGIVSPSDCYVIAVSGSALPAASAPGRYGEPPTVASALYGIGPYRWQIEMGTGCVVESGYSHRPMTVKTATGAEIESDLFLSDKRRGISAVIYSPNDVQNRPTFFGREDGWDLIIFHNEFAAVPLAPGLIKRGQEWGTKDGRLWILADYRNWSP